MMRAIPLSGGEDEETFLAFRALVGKEEQNASCSHSKSKRIRRLSVPVVMY
jgi:hypothetical protein